MLYGIGIIEAWTFDFLILIKDLLATNTLTCLAGGHKFARARVFSGTRAGVRQNEHAGT